MHHQNIDVFTALWKEEFGEELSVVDANLRLTQLVALANKVRIVVDARRDVSRVIAERNPKALLGSIDGAGRDVSPTHNFLPLALIGATGRKPHTLRRSAVSP
jgi:hypothetical protein